VTTRHLLVAAAVLVAVTAGCGSTPSGDQPQPSGVLSVPQARSVEGTVISVRGIVLIGRDGTVRLCEGLSGSYPPQCGGASLVLRGLDEAELPGRETAGGVTWGGPVTVHGIHRDGVLTIDR